MNIHAHIRIHFLLQIHCLATYLVCVWTYLLICDLATSEPKFLLYCQTLLQDRVRSGKS